MRQSDNVKVGDLVLIKDDDLPPKKWMISRVREVFPDEEGNTRKVLLKTAKSDLLRSIHRVSILPVDRPLQSGP